MEKIDMLQIEQNLLEDFEIIQYFVESSSNFKFYKSCKIKKEMPFGFEIVISTPYTNFQEELLLVIKDFILDRIYLYELKDFNPDLYYTSGCSLVLKYKGLMLLYLLKKSLSTSKVGESINKDFISRRLTYL